MHASMNGVCHAVLYGDGAETRLKGAGVFVATLAMTACCQHQLDALVQSASDKLVSQACRNTVDAHEAPSKCSTSKLCSTHVNWTLPLVVPSW